jgi:ribose transport system ATP-binding protein
VSVPSTVSTWRVARAEVHCLPGENGAGKSTLVKIVAGVHQPDEGSITWQREEVRLANPIAAMRLGIKTSYRISTSSMA